MPGWRYADGRPGDGNDVDGRRVPLRTQRQVIATSAGAHSTPKRLPPPGRAPPRRVPFAVLTAAVCLLFAVAGLAVVDDYGMGSDERLQRRSAQSTADYILGASDAVAPGLGRSYGMAFELLLLLAEHALGLQDTRDVYLVRHLLTHLFFIVGGFFCGLLAYRMFGSRTLAVLAMLTFLLHPRLYAHSFFNSKDIPFAVTFMIALYLTHRAFRRDTAGAFALCGIGVGLAIDLRIMGLLLLPAVLALRALDVWQASDAAERHRVLVTGGLFAVVVLATLYVVHPWYWTDPLRFFEVFSKLSQPHIRWANLFRGDLVWFRGEPGVADAVPPYYVPTWFAISSPPLALLAGVVGVLAIGRAGLRDPDRILRNGHIRFGLLLVGCIVLPVAVIVALRSNIFSGWRHMYFLWAPFSLLAAAGLHRLAEWPRWGPSGRFRRAVTYGVAGTGLAGVVVAMASLHPHQQAYFNRLVDRETPGALARAYDIDYWKISQRQAMEYLRERWPDTPLRVWGDNVNQLILPESDRKFLHVVPGRRPPPDLYYDVYIAGDRVLRSPWVPTEPVVHARQVYGSNIFTIVAPRLVWGTMWPDAGVYRSAYRSVVAAGDPAARSDFDVHVGDGALYYVKEDCDPTDTGTRFFLHVFPVDMDDLPPHRRRYGFDNRDFSFTWRGGFFDGKCLTQEPLPDYPVARIETGQFVSGEGRLWKVEIEHPAQAAVDSPPPRTRRGSAWRAIPNAGSDGGPGALRPSPGGGTPEGRDAP